MSANGDYWQEAFEIALEEIGRFDVVESMTREQRAEIGESLATSAEHQSLAFYTPPPSDRIAQVKREEDSRYAALSAEFEAYRATAERVVGRALRVHSSTPISIERNGDVIAWGGRSERIA